MQTAKTENVTKQLPAVCIANVALYFKLQNVFGKICIVNIFGLGLQYENDKKHASPPAATDINYWRRWRIVYLKNIIYINLL